MPVDVQGTLDLSGILADGRIQEDGDLTIKVNSCYYDISGVKGYYSGNLGQVVFDNDVNYVYLDGYGFLRINATGYPDGEPHIRLGRVVASGGFITRIISERALFTDATTGINIVSASTQIIAGDGLTGGGNLTADRTLNVVANADGSIIVNANDIQVGTLANDSQHGNLGGGNLHDAATQSTAGFLSSIDKAKLDNISDGYVSKATQVIAGAVLSGGRDLSSSVTLNVTNIDGSISVGLDTVSVGTLANDGQHGNLGGGSLHSAATQSTAGFLSAVDKAKLDNISDGYVNKNIQVIAGAGLSGGGTLSTSRTIDIVNNDGSISVASDSISVGTLANDGQHGNLGGGSLHSVATESVAGFMSSADKVLLDNLSRGNVTFPVRNETGAALLKGRAISVSGWDSINHIKLVRYADKDDPDRRPALGILQSDLLDMTNGTATSQGLIEGLDTSMYQLTDQLVLGNDGYLSRPPRDIPGFTGEIQNIGSTARIDAVDGHLIISIDGLEAVNANEMFALEGTYGTPNVSNRYVTEQDPRIVGLINGVFHYPISATDPVSPTPLDGYEYYNTVLKEAMKYDSSRSKWLSTASLTFMAGRSGNTAAGSYYRGVDNLTFGTNVGYPVLKGTLTGLSITKTDSLASVVEVLIDGTPFTTLLASSAGATYNWAINADFNEGLMQFRNQIGGNTTSNVQITAIVKRRI